jgi:hypothetical protein
MRNLLCFCFLFLALTACSTTAADRYNQLTKKDAKDCLANVAALQSLTPKELFVGEPVAGELTSENCLSLKNGDRVSYEIYEFVAHAESQAADVLTFINPRGLGFGGENTIAWPMAILQRDGSDVVEIQPPGLGKSKWIRNAWSGDRLQTSFVFKNLAVKSKYRLTIASMVGDIGKGIPGYHNNVAAGRIVIGPLGKTEVSLH